MAESSTTFRKGRAKTGGRRKGGRNKVGADVRDLARDHTSDAIETLADVMNDRVAPRQAQVMAANALLDRGWARPTQAITGPDGGPVEVNVDITREMIARKLDRIGSTVRLLATKADESEPEGEMT